MNRSKNDHIIEMAKKFIDNCNSFEIKDLDADNQYLNNLPAITPFTDRIKEYLNPFEEEQNQNLTKTSSNDLDELCIFEKDMFKLFCTDEFNTYLIRMVNSFVIEAVNVGNQCKCAYQKISVSYVVGSARCRQITGCSTDWKRNRESNRKKGTYHRCAVAPF